SVLIPPVIPLYHRNIQKSPTPKSLIAPLPGGPGFIIIRNLHHLHREDDIPSVDDGSKAGRCAGNCKEGGRMVSVLVIV
ncbi:hypothetical protein KUCAC02_008500, partial [Chaenocephalus aceratus]